MYRLPTEKERVEQACAFGDLFAAPWMADLVLRWDSKPMRYDKVTIGGQQVDVLIPQDPSTLRGRTFPKDTILAHASDPGDLAIGHGTLGVLAVAVSDDCDFADRVHDRKGRLRFAPVSNLPPAGTDARETALKTRAFGRYPVPPQDGEPKLDGGVIEFAQTFSVAAVDVFDRATWVGKIADPNVREKVRYRWSAHATRHGPDTAVDTADKIARLITANGDAAWAKHLREDRGAELDPNAVAIIEPLRKVLLIPWLIEGGQADDIAAALEQGAPFQPTVDALLDALRRLGPAADEAIAALEHAAGQTRIT